MNKKRER